MTFWWAGNGFKVTRLFHLSAMTHDLHKLHEFYGRVFGVTEHKTAPWFSHRFGSFTILGDTWIENVCPDQRWETPLRALSHTVGEHWNSPGMYVEDMQDAVYHLAARHNVRLTAMGTGAPILGAPHPLWSRSDWPDEHYSAVTEAFTHPWDTGVMWILVEFAPDARTVDPRSVAGWRYTPRTDDPLGLERSSHHTIVVDDETVSLRFLVDMCGGTVFNRAENPDLGTQSTWVAVGSEQPIVLEIATPIADGPARADLLRHNSIQHSTTFKVKDLAQAEQHLANVGVGIETKRESLVVTDPKDCCGLRFAFAAEFPEGVLDQIGV